MEMKIHFGLFLFLISSSLFASSQAQAIFPLIPRDKSVEEKTLDVQLEILSLLKQIKEQIKEQNNEVINEVSNGLKEVTNHVKVNTMQVKENTNKISNGLKETTKEITNGLKETTNKISTGLKENTKQAKQNSKVIIDFISEIKDNTNGIKENTDESNKIKINIKDIINKIGENNEKEIEVISEIKEITNDIKQDSNGIKQIVDVVTNSTDYLEEIKPPKNCDDLRLKGDKKSGIRTVYPYPNSPEKSIKVLCDQQTEDGGWTVFQARMNLPERENFYRNWKDYSHGFGDIDGEFWMGLELINVMSKQDAMELRVDLEDDTGEKRFAKYENFSVEDEDEKFKLNIGDYGGTAGDSLRYHNQGMFSTKDNDNDQHSSLNCADYHKGAWWYNNCAYSNLNGLPHVGKYSSSSPDGIMWYHFGGNRNSMAKTKMMFRRSTRMNN